VVYADSLTPISADGFSFTRNTTYPNVLKDFENSFNTLDALPCDILLTPHPDASDLWTRLERHDSAAGANAFVDPTACRRLVEAARERLQARVVGERKG
jgi:metallo-beta-lactamase class B